MSIAPLPPPLEQLGRRSFSFYPPILNVEHNQWMYSRATWSEILVVNAQTGAEVWIARRFLGEVSRVDDPVIIVGLKRELEFRMGAVWPHQRRVIELPVAVNDSHARVASDNAEPAPVINIRLEPSTDIRAGKMIGVALVLGAVACSIIVGITRQAQPRPRIDYSNADQSYLQLNHDDDYFSVIHKLGGPASERSYVASSTFVYRALGYPRRGFTVILLGRTQPEARYLGTIDPERRVLDSARFPGGGDGAAMLRALPRF